MSDLDRVEALLRQGEQLVLESSGYISPGVGEAGVDIHLVILDTAEKISYVLGLLDDERTALANG